MADKILIVDDDVDTLRMVGLMLQREGYDIVAASSGQQAIVLAQTELPDLVLLDVMMPDLDGVEVTRRLRAADSTRDIPIIIFTAKTQVDDKILGFEAGADDYLTKPTQPRELFAHVKAVLSRSRKVRVVDQPAAERGYVVGATAARGGLGVSTLVLNVGVALYEETKQDVVVADFRPGQGTLSMELGYLRPDGFNRLLQCKADEITTRAVEMELMTHSSGVRFLLSSPRPRDAQYASAVGNFEVIAGQLSYLARFVILDLGPSFTPLNEKVFQHCDEVLLVVEPVPQTLSQTKALIDDLSDAGIGEDRISVVLVNRIRSGVQLSWSQVQEQLGRPITTIFTSAPELAYNASQHNLPIVIQQRDSLTSQQFAKLASKIAQRV